MVWAKEQTDKWHRRGIPEIDLHNRVNYFGGGAKAVLWSKDSHFNDDTEQLDVHKPKKNKPQTKKLDTDLTSFTHISQKTQNVSQTCI